MPYQIRRHHKVNREDSMMETSCIVSVHLIDLVFNETLNLAEFQMVEDHEKIQRRRRRVGVLLDLMVPN